LLFAAARPIDATKRGEAVGMACFLKQPPEIIADSGPARRRPHGRPQALWREGHL
jgi:hypothetical protein